MSEAWGPLRRDPRFQLGVCGLRIKLYPRFQLGEGDIRARRDLVSARCVSMLAGQA